MHHSCHTTCLQFMLNMLGQRAVDFTHLDNFRPRHPDILCDRRTIIDAMPLLNDDFTCTPSTIRKLQHLQHKE